MYERYWQLARRPFDNALDDMAYFPSDTHQGTLLKLRYVVEQPCGAATVTGVSGVGKTLLIQKLLRELAPRYAPKVHVVFPQMPAAELLRYLVENLTGKVAGPDDVCRSLQSMGQFLANNTQAGRHAVVAVDEAHLLQASEVWEVLRLLLNFRSSNRQDLTLLLVGQPPLLSRIPRAPGLEDRIDVKCFVRPFELTDTIRYIQNRFEAAGTSHHPFEEAALRTVHELSGGCPRRINRLCDLALLIAFSEELTWIGSDLIRNVAREILTAEDAFEETVCGDLSDPDAVDGVAESNGPDTKNPRFLHGENEGLKLQTVHSGDRDAGRGAANA